jgi:hypothetical protein
VRRWWPLIPAVLLVLLVWPARGFVAIWDGDVYLRCVVDAAAHGMNVESLRCGGHHSQLYMAWLSLTQIAAPGNTTALLVGNLIVAAVALVSFHSLLAGLIPGEAWWRERALLVTALAVNPLVTASLVQPNSDFGVYAFLLAYLAALAARRYWLAAFIGLALCFSKETGAIAAVVTLAVFALSVLRESSGPFATRLRTVAKSLWPATLPILCYFAFLWWWSVTQHSFAIWNQGIHEQPWRGVRLLDFDDVIFRSYAAIIFILCFAWIPTIVIVADGFVGARRTWRGLPDRPMADVQPGLATILVTLTIALTYVLTLYRTWSFPRYFVALVPLLLVSAFLSLIRLDVGVRTRRRALAAFSVLLLAANVRSIDPVSRAIFGVIKVGTVSLYDVSGIAHDFRVRDADHLCYNLQFVGLTRAIDAAYAGIRPDSQTTIVYPSTNRWGFWNPLDRTTYARTASPEGGITPRYADERTIAAMRSDRPAELWYIQQPTDADRTALESLGRFYDERSAASYTADGFTVVARHLVRRPSPMLP